MAQAATSSQGSASKQKRFDPAHLLRRVHLFRIRLKASSQGSIGRELEASSQTQTQTLHLPDLDMSNWFRAGRLHLNITRSLEPEPAQTLKKARPSPSLLDESICSGLEASRQGSLGRKLGASSQTQTQTLHLPDLDMSNWFRAGRLHLNITRSLEPEPAQTLKKARPSPSLLDESICSGLEASRQGSLGRKLGASSQT